MPEIYLSPCDSRCSFSLRVSLETITGFCAEPRRRGEFHFKAECWLGFAKAPRYPLRPRCMDEKGYELDSPRFRGIKAPQRPFEWWDLERENRLQDHLRQARGKEGRG